MEIEKLFISLALDAAKYTDGLNDAQKQGTGWAAKMRQTIGGGIATAAKIASGALLGVGLTIGGVAASGINSFIGFQNQMNEVFTLMPGISQDAMDDMSDQVLQFSKDFAVLPDQVVPALYQSLSAGVPPDNVFAFLETAQKAAVGGVTDLETAVDGITSVVNAYGADVLDAANASDIMFTAVRLGKTDFSQLSSSLFNVIPTAASMGVTFGDVAAQLATLTAQGTPTSVATTQIRAALVEASKGGTKLSDAISDLTGSSFAELIQQGQTVPQIFQQLRDSMPEQDFKDLFGSVEAMNAVLGVTGPNFDTVTAAMDQMTDSAGATDAAYEQMNGGIKRVMDRFRAFGSATLIQIGDALSPVIDKVLDLAEQALPAVESALSDVTGFISGVFSNLESGQDILTAVIDSFLNFTNVGENLSGDGFQFLIDLETGLRNIWEQLQIFWAALQPVIETVITAVSEFISWKDILIAIGLLIGGVILNVIIGLVSALAPVVVAVVAIIGVISLLRNAWENDWLGIKTALIDFWENTAKPALAELWAWLSETVPAALETLRAWWVDTAWPAIQNALEIAWAIISFVLAAMWDSLINVIIPAIVALWDYWVNTAWPAIQTALANAWAAIEPILIALKDFIINTVIPTVQDLYTKWTTIWWPTIQTVLENVWAAIVVVFQEIDRWINTNIVPWLEFLHTQWTTVWWPAIATAVETAWGIIQPLLETAQTWLEENVPAALDSLKTAWDSVWTALAPVVEPVRAAIDGIKNAVEAFWDFITSHTFNFNIHIPDLPDWAVPGSPLPIHTAWANFASEMNHTTIRPKVDLVGVTAVTGAALAASGYTDNRRSETVINMPPGQDPMRVIRSSRHIDKINGRGGR